MNNLFVPPSPNWFNSEILACTPDNTLIYGSKGDLIIISEPLDGDSLHVRSLDRAHSQKVISVDVNIHWGSPNKWVVTSGEDGIVKLWDILKLCKISSHEAHKEQKDKLVGSRFLTEDRILSVSELGSMYIWHPSNKEFTKMSNFFQMKVNITSFSPCPHATFITAFGLKNGLIVIANLKKNGTLLHKLRGHTNEIISLSWCPAPVNIFPSNPNNYIKGTTPPEKFIASETIDETMDEPQGIQDDIESVETSVDPIKISVENAQKSEDNNDHSQNYEGTKNVVVKKNPWINLKFEDDEEIEDESDHKTQTIIPNFLEECDILKKKIESLSLDISETDSNFNKSDVKTEPEPDEEVENANAIDESQIHSLSVSQSISIVKNEEERMEENTVTNNEEKKIDKTSESPSELKSKYSDGEFKSSDEITLRNDSAEMKFDKNTESPSKLLSRNSVPEEPRKDYLLASSGKDSTIYIWRAGTDGRLQCFFKLPEMKGHYKNKDKKIPFWTVVKWVSPFTLLSSNKKGSVLSFCLPRPIDPKKQFSIVHNDHTSNIFAIAAHIPTLTLENWLSKIETRFWTFGQDMYLFNTSLDSKTHSTLLETFCALIQCLAQSPLDPSRVCLGLSNGTIKIWNENEHDARSFSTKNYSPKIYSKISSLAWHPMNEMLLAFSTEEGTIGCLNTANHQKVTWFKQTFSSKVHKIEWGPHNESKSKMGLYATGNGVLRCFNPDDPKSDALEINLFSDTIAYTFAWKLDYSIMLVAATTGKLIAFNPDFSIKATYYEKKKPTILAWHPDSAVNSEEITSRSFWVATVLDSVVYIYDFAELSTKDGVLDIQNVPRIVLDGHKCYIQSLAWSPFDGNRLVTAGEDGLANVWNVTTQEILATFHRENFEPIKSILWSAVHEDTLICSTVNASLVVWKMSDYPAPLSPEMLSKYVHHLKSEKKSVSMKEHDAKEKMLKKNKQANKTAILPNLNSGSHENTLNQVKILQELLIWKETGNVLSNGVPNIKQLFGTKDDVLKLLNLNEASHIEKGKYEAASKVSFWKGDFQNGIKEAIEQRRVTPFIISLAPSVSLGMWQKACETYASQLEEIDASDPLEIATYYMACQNIEKALQSLCERQLFKEALVLAKCRLPENNVYIEKVLLEWASFSTYHGSLETAAQCYIVLGKFEEAARVLFRRSEVDILNFALILAKKTENDELVKAIEFRCKAFSQEEIAVDANERLVENTGEGDTLKKTDENPIDSEPIQEDKEIVEDMETIQKEVEEMIDVEKKISVLDRIVNIPTQSLEAEAVKPIEEAEKINAIEEKITELEAKINIIPIESLGDVKSTQRADEINDLEEKRDSNIDVTPNLD